MVRRISIEIEDKGGVLKRFGNQLEAVGAGQARVAMARAVNYAGRKTNVQLKRELRKQTSIPTRILNATIKTRAAKHQGASNIEFVIFATASEVPLKEFNPRQFKMGIRARVWGGMQRYPGMFMNAGRWNSGIGMPNGHVFVRTGGFSEKSGRNNAIEKTFGPSVPKEMVIGKTAETFQRMASYEMEKRLRHELSRILPL